MKVVRIFLMVEATTLATLLALYFTTETYFHKFLEIVFGLPSSSDGVYGTYAKELTPKTSTFHDIQSVTGDVLCLVLILRALYRQPHNSGATSAALLAIFCDHLGFAIACGRQWGFFFQPVIQGGVLAFIAFALWYSGGLEEDNLEKKEK